MLGGNLRPVVFVRNGYYPSMAAIQKVPRDLSNCP